VESVVAFIDQIRHDIQQPMMTGIALPGSVSPLNGLIKNSNIQVINGRPLQTDLRQLLGQTVVMANDGNCLPCRKPATVRGSSMRWCLVSRSVPAAAAG
jgi:fructokinase